MTSVTPRPILLIEDNDADAKLLMRAFKRAAPEVVIHRMSSGEEALAYIGGMRGFEDRMRYPLPALVLLDLNLPDLAGLQILNVIRHHKGVPRIPVVVLSGASDDASINSAYEAGVSSFLVKEFDPAKLEKVAGALAAYWLGFNRLPEKVAAARR